MRERIIPPLFSFNFQIEPRAAAAAATGAVFVREQIETESASSGHQVARKLL